MSKRYSTSTSRGSESPAQARLQDAVTFREDSPRPPVPGSEDLKEAVVVEKSGAIQQNSIINSAKLERNSNSAFRSVSSKSSNIVNSGKLRLVSSPKCESVSTNIPGRNERPKHDQFREGINRSSNIKDGDSKLLAKGHICDEVNGNVWLLRDTEDKVNRIGDMTGSCQTCCNCAMVENTARMHPHQCTNSMSASYPAFHEDSTTSWSSKYGEPEDLDGILAPRGFEPEGSSCRSPDNLEKAEQSDSYFVRWSDDLKQLMEDREGVAVFRSYTNEVMGSCAIEFWLAVTGFRKMAAEIALKHPVPPGEEERVRAICKVIGRKYVKNKQLSLSPESKQDVLDRLKLDHLDATVFDVVLEEVERLISIELYPKFLTSDAYSNYILLRRSTASASPISAASASPRAEKATENNCSAGTQNSETCNSNPAKISGSIGVSLSGESPQLGHCPVLGTPTMNLSAMGLLPTLHEDEELSSNERTMRSHDLSMNRCVSPCSSSYLPVSAQDSDVLNFSSDFTDDTMSLTDSSVDGRQCDYEAAGNYGGLKYSYKKQQTLIRRNADANRSTDLNHSILQQKTSMPKERYLAEKDPAKFVEVLTERLQRVCTSDIETKYNTIHEAMNYFDQKSFCEESVGVSQLPGGFHRVSRPAGDIVHMPGPLKSQLLKMAKEDPDDWNAESILERHVKRVFDWSNGQSPNSGHHSPEITNKGASMKHPLSGTEWTVPRSLATGAGPVHPRQSGRRGVDALPQHTIMTSKSCRPTEQQMMMMKNSCGVFSHDELLQMSGGSKSAPVVSGGVKPTPVISGVGKPAAVLSGEVKKIAHKMSADQSVPYNEAMQSTDTATNRKVILWMNGNEKQGGATVMSTDSSDSATRASSELKQSSDKSHSKKTRSVHAGDMNPIHRSAVRPAQPFVQDPLMPLMGLPDTCTQLEEAKRRLEEESKPKSSKLKSGQRGASSVICASQKQVRSTSVQQSSFDQQKSSSEEHSSSSQKSDPRLSKKTSVGVSAQSNNPSLNGLDVISIIYFFCEESIPYSTRIFGRHSASISLQQFKQVVSKKGHYKYYFKRACDEFESGFVYEEIDEDSAILPIIDGKISAKISRLL